MKYLILFLLGVAPLFTIAQSNSKEIENAYFEVNVNGESAYFTDIHSNNVIFTKSQYRSLQQIAMEKEGVFDVSYVNNGKTIRIAHLSFVERETLKSFALSVADDIEIMEREVYSF